MVTEEELGDEATGEPSDAEDEVTAELRKYRQTGDSSCRDHVVTLHLGLVRQLARRFARQGDAVDDLFQAGSVGLLKAVEGFDPELGFKFSAYAAATIIGELKRHLRDKGWAVRPPRRVQELCLEIGQATSELTQRLGRAPTVQELASETGSEESDVLEALEAGQAYRMAPLEPTSPAGEASPAPHLGVEDENLGASEGRILLQQVLDKLPPQDRLVIELRYFEDLTQAEIGARLGVSQMQVSRMLARILRRLRELDAPPELAPDS